MSDDAKEFPCTDEQIKQLEHLKSQRPLTQQEKLFRGGLAMGMGVPRHYVLDDEDWTWKIPPGRPVPRRLAPAEAEADQEREEK